MYLSYIKAVTSLNMVFLTFLVLSSSHKYCQVSGFLPPHTVISICRKWTMLFTMTFVNHRNEHVSFQVFGLTTSRRYRLSYYDSTHSIGRSISLALSRVNVLIPVNHLSLEYTFDACVEDNFWKHRYRNRIWSWWVISPFPQCFQVILKCILSFIEIYYSCPHVFSKKSTAHALYVAKCKQERIQKIAHCK